MKSFNFISLILIIVILSLTACEIPFITDAESTFGSKETWLRESRGDAAYIEYSVHTVGSCVFMNTKVDNMYYVKEIIDMLRILTVEELTEDEISSLNNKNASIIKISVFDSEGKLLGAVSRINGYLVDSNNNYYSYEGEFPASYYVDDKIRDALNEYFPGISDLWYSQLNTTNKNVTLIFLQSKATPQTLERKVEKVAGKTFTYPAGYRVVVFYKDKIYSVSEAYMRFCISTNDVAEIQRTYIDKINSVRK